MMKYSQVLYLGELNIASNLVIIHHEVGVSEKELLEWYSKKYEFEKDRLLISACPVPLVECPLLASDKNGQ